MNPFVSCVLLGVLAAAPHVELSTLKGEQHAGRLQRLSPATLTLKQDGKELKVPVSEILDVRFQSSGKQKPAGGNTAQIVLGDGSRFRCTKVIAAARKLSIESTQLGKFSVPLSSVASIRFASKGSRVDQAWNELAERERKRDLLVIRKKDVLDHLDGVVGGIDDRFVRFLLDGDEIPVQREKVYGVIYARRSATETKPLCQAVLTDSGVLQLSAVSWDGKQLKATLLAGAEVQLPLDGLRNLDFSLGKVQYLSAMEPRRAELTPYFDDGVERELFRYRRDRNQNGDPLKLRNTTYARGLWIHSKTRLQYWIGGEYRRFQAVMGIDDLVAAEGKGDVHVVISGDGKVLLQADVRGVDKPRVLDLDVTGVRQLEILVDYGGDIDIADHLDLADAKVIK